MELENVNEVMVKRRRNDYPTPVDDDELRIEDLRHESLNQILKQNMEILKHVDTDLHMHHGRNTADFGDDDLDNNNDSLSGESLLNGVDVSNSCCGGGDSNNNSSNRAELHEIHKLNDDSEAVLNQLIDDEQNSVNDDDDVSRVPSIKRNMILSLPFLCMLCVDLYLPSSKNKLKYHNIIETSKAPVINSTFCMIINRKGRKRKS